MVSIEVDFLSDRQCRFMLEPCELTALFVIWSVFIFAVVLGVSVIASLLDAYICVNFARGRN